MSVADALVNLNLVSAKKGFQIQKALGISEAVINTLRGIQKVFAETTDFTPTQSLRFANAAIIAAAGAANVAKIASQKFNAGSSGLSGLNVSGGNGSPNTSPTPRVNLEDIIGQQERPVKAYVVATDVSNAQEANKKIKNQNTL